MLFKMFLSRAALITGRYASSIGLSFAILNGAISGLPDFLPTLPRLLRQAGYFTHTDFSDDMNFSLPTFWHNE